MTRSLPDVEEEEAFDGEAGLGASLMGGPSGLRFGKPGPLRLQ